MRVYYSAGHQSWVGWTVWSSYWICSVRRLLSQSIGFLLRPHKIHGLLYRWGYFCLWSDSIFRMWRTGWGSSRCRRNSFQSIFRPPCLCRWSKWHCPIMNTHHWGRGWDAGFSGYSYHRHIYLSPFQSTGHLCWWDRCSGQICFLFAGRPGCRWLSGWQCLYSLVLLLPNLYIMYYAVREEF